MEKEGVIQSLKDILDSFQLDVEAITTDEHSDEMKTNPKLTYFKHQFDHCALQKCYKKTYTKATKTKGLNATQIIRSYIFLLF